MIHLISEMIIPAGKEGIVLEKGLLSDGVGRGSHRFIPQISSRYGRIFGNNWTCPTGSDKTDALPYLFRGLSGETAEKIYPDVLIPITGAPQTAEGSWKF